MNAFRAKPASEHKRTGARRSLITLQCQFDMSECLIQQVRPLRLAGLNKTYTRVREQRVHPRDEKRVAPFQRLDFVSEAVEIRALALDTGLRKARTLPVASRRRRDPARRQNLPRRLGYRPARRPLPRAMAACTVTARRRRLGVRSRDPWRVGLRGPRSVL